MNMENRGQLSNIVSNHPALHVGLPLHDVQQTLRISQTATHGFPCTLAVPRTENNKHGLQSI